MTKHVRLTNVPRRVKLRVEDYLALDKSGAFDDYGRTELIDGDVVYMNAQHRPHARIKSRLHVHIALALEQLRGELEAIVEGSISVPPHNVPEPDIVLTTEPEGTGLIPLEATRLVIEVADATLRSDLTRKAAIYAAHGIPEYWVVDVNGAVIHQMWSPAGKRYGEQRETAFGHPVTSATVAGLTIATDAL